MGHPWLLQGNGKESIWWGVWKCQENLAFCLSCSVSQLQDPRGTTSKSIIFRWINWGPEWREIVWGVKMSLRQSQDQRSAPTRVLFLFPRGYIHKPRDMSTSCQDLGHCPHTMDKWSFTSATWSKWKSNPWNWENVKINASVFQRGETESVQD